MEKKPKFRIDFVYCIIDKTNNSVVRGVRTGDSPFYTSELFAARKCAQMNSDLKKYNKEPIYQVEEYRLISNRIIDMEVCPDEVVVQVNEEQKEKDKKNQELLNKYQSYNIFYGGN